MKTLSEVKEIIGTEKVFETATSFGVNNFGKYQPWSLAPTFSEFIF